MSTTEEPRIGSTMRSRDGRKWRKVRRLGRDAWLLAMDNMTFGVRFFGMATDKDAIAMGYEDVTP